MAKANSSPKKEVSTSIPFYDSLAGEERYHSRVSNSAVSDTDISVRLCRPIGRRSSIDGGVRPFLVRGKSTHHTNRWTDKIFLKLEASRREVMTRCERVQRTPVKQNCSARDARETRRVEKLTRVLSKAVLPLPSFESSTDAADRQQAYALESDGISISEYPARGDKKRSRSLSFDSVEDEPKLPFSGAESDLGCVACRDAAFEVSAYCENEIYWEPERLFMATQVERRNQREDIENFDPRATQNTKRRKLNDYLPTWGLEAEASSQYQHDIGRKDNTLDGSNLPLFPNSNLPINLYY